MTHLDLGMPNWRYLKQHAMRRLHAFSVLLNVPLFFPTGQPLVPLELRRVSGGAGGALGNSTDIEDQQ